MISEVVADLEKKYTQLWDAVKPKVGETWEKKPCAGRCRIGWSFGVGVRQIEDNGYDYGAPHHLECGCLVKLNNAQPVEAIADIEATCPHCGREQQVDNVNKNEIGNKESCWKCEKPFQYFIKDSEK